MPAGVAARRYTLGVRLDRYDSYLTTFHTSIAGLRENSSGKWVRLDRSAFYPSAGGQPNDTGVLTIAGNRLNVLDVETAGGHVWHLLEPSYAADPLALAEGEAVVGELDWPRRFAHMQRHSAQHLLSATLVRYDPAFVTVAVSMRGPDCTIEVPAEITATDLVDIEAEADRVARLNLPITAFEVEEERLAEYELRRPAKVAGVVRLVAIGQYDLVACGGTHLRATAEALPIKLMSSERVRGGNTRLMFRAGHEAFEDYRTKSAAATRVGQLLSARAPELPQRAEQLLANLAAAGQEAAAWRSRVARSLAAELAAATGGGRALVAVLEGDDAPLLTDLMEACQRLEGAVALLAGVVGDKAQLAFVAGPGADQDVRPLLAEAMAALGGRGGGRPDRAQGAATATASQVAAALEAQAAKVGG